MHPILADRRRLFAYVAAWEVLGALLAALLVSSSGFTWASALLLSIPLCAVYAFACLGAFWVCRAAPLRLAGVTRVAGSQLAAATLAASLWLVASRVWAAVLEGAGAFPGLIGRQRGAAPLLFAMGLLLFLLAAALHYLLVALEDSRLAETEALRFQILSREAELRALRAQIHPHFLFNSLNSINALVTSRPEEARRVCVLLADFLRRSLSLGTRERVPLSEELALAEDLLAIEKVRFGGRLVYVPQIGQDTLACAVPPLLLQPLVENAITHGIAQCLEGGTVQLDAHVSGGRLLVTVENPRDATAPVRKGTGIGIENVRRRLETVYGRDAELRVRPRDDSFRVELELPAAPA
jgi:two-component system, LytTR family, sensor histidine kinase AlgZ